MISDSRKISLIRLAIKIGKRLPFNKKPKQIMLRDRIGQYERMWSGIAAALGGELERLDRDCWEIRVGTQFIRTRLHELPLEDNVNLKVCGKKPLVSRLLGGQGVPVAEHKVLTSANMAEAYTFLTEHPHGCVVKPVGGWSGLGVITHVCSRKQMLNAVVHATYEHDEFMVEQQVPGESFRLLVYKGKLLHAVRRRGDYVRGDGTKSLDELCSNITRDEDFKFTVAAQGYQLSDVPANESQILVRSVGSTFNGGKELRTIYDEDVTDVVHPAIVKDMEKCAAILQGNFLGIDVVTTDISKDLRETGGVVIEVNTTPGLHHHYDSSDEDYPEIILNIVKDLFEKKAG